MIAQNFIRSIDEVITSKAIKKNKIPMRRMCNSKLRKRKRKLL